MYIFTWISFSFMREKSKDGECIMDKILPGKRMKKEIL